MLKSIYNSYDIRGIYGLNLTKEIAFKIGRAFVDFLRKTQKCEHIAVGRDIREHSAPLFAAITDGIRAQGANVIDLGECSTPMSYFGTGFTRADAGIMITASHLPDENNGFKLSRANAVPVAGDTGIMEIKAIVESGNFAPAAATPGTISECDISEDYARMIRKSADIPRPLKIVADMTFAMGIWEAKVFEGLPLAVTPLYGDLAQKDKVKIHGRDPLDHGNFAALSAAVQAGKGKYAFGVMYDPDADRTGFTDENGRIIPMDIITALIAQAVLQKHPGAAVGYDLRSSRVVDETIRAAGGKPFRTRVGHSKIKTTMRKMKAQFSGELSGHFYYRHEPRKGAFVYGESSALTTILIANILGKTKKPLSELVKPIQRYFTSGEINTVFDSDKAAEDAFARVTERFRDECWIDTLDGVSVLYPDWWFNIRPSNTEPGKPKIRLNVESVASPKHLSEKLSEVKKLLGGEWQTKKKKAGH